MSSILKHWREAATLLLVARVKTPVVQPSKGSNFQVLMLKRSGKSKFMPSLHVFPGGTAHDSDFSSEWLEIFSRTGADVVNKLLKFLQKGGVGAPMFSRPRPEEFSKIPSELAFRICAIRETFEESGILLVRSINTVKNESSTVESHPLYGKSSVLSETILMPWRKRVDNDPSQFLTMCQELNVVPDVWSLYEWSNWLTPLMPTTYRKQNADGKTAGRRYDTAFYLSVLDHIPAAAHDDKETVALEWTTAKELLQKHYTERSDLRLAPPQIIELSRLLNFSDADDLKAFAWQRSETRVQPYLPVPCHCDDGLLYLYPGDDLYPSTPDREGSYPTMVVQGTVKELSKMFPNQNRSEIYPDKNGQMIRTLRCNVKMPDGQVSPLLTFEGSAKL